MTWKAALDRILVKRTPEAKTTAGGLVLPDKMKGNHARGTVVAAGPGGHGVLPGDTIIFPLAQAVLIEDDVYSILADYVYAIQRAE